MIPITQPFLPPVEEYQQYLSGVWQRNWLTNDGPLVRELESKLRNYLDLKHLLYVSNGTIALQIAIKALDLQGEIITTPFSFVATTSSIVWEGCKPVFVDIDENTLNIDPHKIEAAITPKTSAILATHVFGNPCEVEAIQAIADKYGLKVIYDGAHAFGVNYKGKSIFEYGDISTASFHATKLYHSTEGGAVISKSAKLTKSMSRLRNFGHDGPGNFNGVGINGKNSEFHAAMGLCNLKYIAEILAKRKELSLYYNTKIDRLKYVFRPTLLDAENYNYAYYPIILESEERLLKLKAYLEQAQVFPRRYFYPSLSSLRYIDHQFTPISDSIARRVLCLPMYHKLQAKEIDYICKLITNH